MTDAVLQIDADRLSIKQIFDAPVEKVFDCFTQPQILNQWFSPSESIGINAQLDLNVGGAYRFEMLKEDGEDHIAVGEFTEINPPTRLAFTWAWEGSDDPVTLVTISLRKIGQQTEVELVHSGFSQAEATQHHSQGWSGIYARLTKLFTQ